MATYSDLKPAWGVEHKAMGGTQQIAYFASIEDILTEQEPTPPFTNPEDEYVIDTPHVMKTGKKFWEMYTEQNKGEVKFEKMGSLDSTGHKVTGKVFIPGDSKKLNYFANKVQEDKFMLLVPDADGTINQIGGKKFPATITLNKNTSTNENGALGYEGTYEAIMPKKLIYDAAVPTTPAA